MNAAPKLDLELEALVAGARAAEPPQQHALAARRMVRVAIEDAQAARKTSYAWLWAVAAVVVLGFVARGLLGVGVTSVEVAARDRPLRLALKSGDTLVAAPGAELQIMQQEAEARRVRVSQGAALFDVVPLSKGQSFRVETADVSLTVVGTVFTVEVLRGRTVVRVYEGKVSVRGVIVAAGGVWVSTGEIASLSVRPLDDEARQAARAREIIVQPSLPAAAGQPEFASKRFLGVDDAPAPRVSPLPSSSQPGAASAASKTFAAAPVVQEGASLADARALLERGNTEDALAIADAHASELSGAWTLLSADALRALGRFSDAMLRYQQAAHMLAAGEAEAAAFTAASIALHQMADPLRAMALLDAYHLDDDQARLRERATVLHVDALLALGQSSAARVHALRYLGREPVTETSARMRLLVEHGH
jgi:hypothetical protein